MKPRDNKEKVGSKQALTDTPTRLYIDTGKRSKKWIFNSTGTRQELDMPQHTEDDF